MITTLVAMALFSLSMSISPGPVNLIALSSGVNHGFARAFPFVSGATVGFTLLLAAIGFGFGTIALASKLFMNVIALCGTAFIAYMGIQILKASDSLDFSHATASSFSNGFLLQWMNPKAWIACVSGITAFDASTPATLVTFVSIYFGICYLSISVWAMAGDKIRHLLAQPDYLRYFNLAMGSSLLLVAVYLFFRLAHQGLGQPL